MTSKLVQALSRLAGNRQSDGTSSLINGEDREAIITGCHNLMVAARQAPAPQDHVMAAEPVAWRCRHKNDGPHMWEYYPLSEPKLTASDNVVVQEMNVRQLLDVLNDDKHAAAQERPPEPHAPAELVMVTEEMVNAADSILSRSRPGIPDDVIRQAIAAALSEGAEG